MPGINEVAQLAGVSSATVSRALSGNGQVSPDAKRRVHAAALELGYVVASNASSLASGRTKNVGIVTPFLNRWFYGAVLEGAESALLGHGYDLTLYNLSGGAEERASVFEHFLLRKRVDAVIAVSLELTPEEVERLLELGKPIVGLGGPLPGVPTLSVDDIAIAHLATQHLTALGHRSIAHIGGYTSHELDFAMPSNRRIGWERALTEAGVEVDQRLFQATDFTLPGGYAAAKQLLGDPRRRPTAIFAASDEIAMGAIHAARDLGLQVPHDLSVVGIDDHELSEFFGLTTVAQFPALQGQMAVDLVMDQLTPGHRDPSLSNRPLPFEIMVRSSTTRPFDA